MVQETSTIWVCQDCLFVHANGETEGAPARPPLGMIPVGDSVALGMDYKEHASDCAAVRFPMVCECDKECETINFSSRECEGCGSMLAGSRHALTLFHN